MNEQDFIGQPVRRVMDGPSGPVGTVVAWVDDEDETGREPLVEFPGEVLTAYSVWALTLADAGVAR